MLSLEPFQELETAPERLVVPCGFYLIAASQDLRAVNDPAAPEAVANGQFILIRRAVYDAVGGHAAVKAEFSEDTALARLVKHAGFRLAVLGAERLVRTRMYRGWRSVWHGVSKNAVDIAGGIAPTLLIAGGGFGYAMAALGLAGLATTRLTGPSGSDIAGAALLAAGLAAALGLHVAGARHFRIPVLYGLAFPAGYALAFALAVNSARLALRGRIPWKGRVYGEAEGADALRSSGPRG
jgi:chlorobactene glucosyltransferase